MTPFIKTKINVRSFNIIAFLFFHFNFETIRKKFEV